MKINGMVMMISDTMSMSAKVRNCLMYANKLPELNNIKKSIIYLIIFSVVKKVEFPV